jgi:hypothetical protein
LKLIKPIIFRGKPRAILIVDEKNAKTKLEYWYEPTGTVAPPRALLVILLIVDFMSVSEACLGVVPTERLYSKNFLEEHLE